MNYIILNGINSNTISGLLIQELSPISKPAQRTIIEEIDGRDGDIVTKLGYAAYDKEISIGLYGDFDINDVIAYFNSEGTVVFSNEPDKYYNYQILNQIDFERLIRFRTATVTLHCQPFKYSTTESEIELDGTIITAEGTNLTLTNTEDTALFTEIELKGDTFQQTYSGKNLLNIQTIVKGRLDNGVIGYASNVTELTLNDDSFSFTTNANYRGVTTDYIEVNENATYAFSSNQTMSNAFRLVGACYDINKTYIGDFYTGGLGNKYLTFTTRENTAYVRVYFYLANSGSITVEYPQIENWIGSQTSYEPYVGGIPSPNPSYPQEVKTVTGDNTITIYGKNLFIPSTNSNQGITSTINSDGSLGISGTATNTFSNITNISQAMIIPAGTYTFSIGSAKTFNTVLRLYYTSTSYVNAYINAGSTSTTVTLTAPTISAYVYIYGYTSGTVINDTMYLQLENGNTKTEFEAYESQTYLISLGSIELCEIDGTYDYIYNNSGTWYLHKVSDKISSYNGETITTGYISTTSQLTTGATVYYLLTTPTDTEITDSTLLSQLEALGNATTYLGVTHIITSGEELTPIIFVEALSIDDPVLVVTNNGNTTAKPVMTLYGTGTINLSLNGKQIFVVDLSSENYITIDIANMEAYYNGILKNRLVTGNYENFVLQQGENEITFTGTLYSLTISNYSRWI